MIMKKCLLIFSSFLVFISCAGQTPKILVFTKTEGYRHSSIEVGVQAIQKWAKDSGYIADHSEDADVISYNTLTDYSTIVFLNTTGNIFTEVQQNEFEKYIQQGGGFVGIHSAADTEYQWPWYGKLVGAYFESHPEIQLADIQVINRAHSCTNHLPETWTRRDEWYNYKDFNPKVNILLKMDESSYTGGKDGIEHPIGWYHEYDGGKAFYTGLGHTEESYAEEAFLKHIFAGIEWTFAK